MIVKIKKKPLLVLRNRVYIYTQFDAQNAGNSVSELPDLKFFWGSMPPDPPSKRGLAAPCQYCRLLLSNWLTTSNFIETPADTLRSQILSFKACLPSCPDYKAIIRQLTTTMVTPNDIQI